MNIYCCIVCKKCDVKLVELAKVNLKTMGETPICICEECAHEAVMTFEHWNNE